MNIFEIINKKEYENLSVINDGKKVYTLKEIKEIILPVVQFLKSQQKSKVLILSKNNFDFAINFIAGVFAQKEILLLTDSKKIQKLDSDYILLDEIYTHYSKDNQKDTFISSTDSDYLLNLCNKQVQHLTTSPAQPTSAWGHFRKMLNSAPLALRVPLLQARSHSDTSFEFTTPEFDNTFVTFYTSGSTGNPKAIKKRLSNMIIETNDLLSELEQITGDKSGIQIVTSASANHMYGFVYWFFAAICGLGRYILNTCEIVYPDTADLDSRIFVSTPSFLEEFKKYAVAIDKPPKIIFSAGDRLKNDVSEYFNQYNAQIIEIYGSTETGTIAYKCDNEYYHCFKHVQISQNNESQIVIKSPYFMENEVILCDTVQILDKNKFTLGQRTDKIVKIQEKRVNTQEIEDILNTTGLIDNSYCFKHGEKLSCAAVLNEKGRTLYLDNENGGRQNVIKQLKSFIKEKSEVIPQKWKFLYEIPKNSRGKIDKEKISEFFDVNLSLPLVINYKRTDTTAEYELVFSKNCNFFDGHFKDFPVLPGVIQLYFAHRFASDSFDCNVLTTPVKKMKFSHIIKPDTKVKLILQKYGKNIHYKYEYNDIIFSGGVFETAD